MLQKAKSAGATLREKLILPNNASGEQLTYPMDIEAPIQVSDVYKGDASRQPRRYDIFHYSFFDKEGIEILPINIRSSQAISSNLPLRDQLVIEELFNEYQISEQQLLQLTPDLIRKFPNTQSLYNRPPAKV